MRDHEDWREGVHSTKYHTSVKRLKNANDHEQEIHAAEEQSSELALLPPPQMTALLMCSRRPN